MRQDPPLRSPPPADVAPVRPVTDPADPSPDSEPEPVPSVDADAEQPPSTGSETVLGPEADDEAASPEEKAQPDHLQDVADGCGCTEIWEHLSEEE